MPINTDTYVTRIPLNTQDLETVIKELCDNQAFNSSRRLVAAFHSYNNIVLIFQADNE